MCVWRVRTEVEDWVDLFMYARSPGTAGLGDGLDT